MKVALAWFHAIYKVPNKSDNRSSCCMVLGRENVTASGQLAATDQRGSSSEICSHCAAGKCCDLLADVGFQTNPRFVCE